MSARPSRLLVGISLLAVAGIVISSISLYHHYGTSPTSFCSFGESFNCDMVNRSIYSVFLGVPVAAIGIAGYFGLLALATLYRNRAQTPGALLGASLIGLGFALYLTYIEAFVLVVWCMLCMSSLGIILVITIMAFWLFLQSRRVAES